MSLVDVVLVIWFIVAARIGWKSGFIAPLLTELGLLVGLYLMHSQPGLVSRLFEPGPARLIGGAIFLAVAGTAAGFVAGKAAAFVAHHLPFISSIDRFAGFIIHTAITFVLAYVVLAGLITFDGLLSPLHGAKTVTNDQVTSLRGSMQTDPLAYAMAGEGGLDSLAQMTAKGPVAISDLRSLDGPLGFYELDVRPQLIGSRLTPYILQYGNKLPIVGRNVQMPSA